MRLKRHERLLHQLAGLFNNEIGGHKTPESAYDELKSYTGQDFGYDVEAWRKWFEDNNKLSFTKHNSSDFE